MRQAASIAIWGAVFDGGRDDTPSPMFPYWKKQEEFDPQKLRESAISFANSIEPKPGGGYQWTAEALKRMRETTNGIDNNRPA